MSGIFIKCNSSVKLSKKKILETIPPNCYTTEQINLQNNHIEWRWKIYKINGKEYIEISYKKPNENRKYINNNSEWIELNAFSEFEQYVIKTFYYYDREDREDRKDRKDRKDREN